MRFDLSSGNECDCNCGTGTGTGTGPGFDGCSSCDSPPDCWFIEILNVGNLPNRPINCDCTSVPDLMANFPPGLFLASAVGSCVWQAESEDADFIDVAQCFGANNIFFMDLINLGDELDDCTWIVSIKHGSLGPGDTDEIARYEIFDCDFNCDEPLTLNKIPKSTNEKQICDWPDTIRIIPNNTCLDTGTGTGTTPIGTGTPNDCPRRLCLWEVQGNQWINIYDGCEPSGFLDCNCPYPIHVDPPFNFGFVNGDLEGTVCGEELTCITHKCSYEFQSGAWILITDTCALFGGEGDCNCSAAPAVIGGEQEGDIEVVSCEPGL